MSLRMEAGFEHLREAISEVLARIAEFPIGMIVTVLSAKVTANTAHAKIVLSVFPSGTEDQAKATLREYDAEIKEALIERLRLRRIPRLHFTFDATEAKAEVIETQLNELKERGEL